MKRPSFWEHDGLAAHLLSPLSVLWTLGTRWRQASTKPAYIQTPVVCIGNVTAGGASKTPVTAALAERLSAQGWRPHILSRGYGGRLRGPVRVDPDRHSARDVGDEPLLLARHAHVWVGADRVRSAARAMADDAEILLMDDGLQNPQLTKDLSLLVIDGPWGLGNGRVMPAGPLREPLADATARCRVAVIVGEDRQGFACPLAAAGLVVLHAQIEPVAEALAFQGEPVYAFAGIARPGKFFATLESIGADVRHTRSFPDHHVFHPMLVTRMLEDAHAMGARLVTTEKDWLRLDAETRPLAEPVRVSLVFREPEKLDDLLLPLRSHSGL
ncbi:MAG: tetraacyldisaccharide 4'-kinase [Rhodospirillales bacterium]|nr:tetraacyldisaccharide 4'-kinase [Rhodospirillales bacterium]